MTSGPLSERGIRISQVEGVLRATASSEREFAKTVERGRTPDGLWLPHPKPPALGTNLLLEVIHRSTRERICAVEAVVARVAAEASGDRPAGMALGVVRVQPGCGEEVRAALEASLLPDASETQDAGVVVGIDLGTTYTCAAIVQDGVPKVIRSRLGYNTIPSMLTYDDQGLPVVGHIAERRMVLAPTDVVYGSKRLIGRIHSPVLVSQLADHMRYGLVRDAEGMVAVQVGDRERVVSPIEVAACILAEIKKVAETELQQPVRRAVISVPAAFTEKQRGAVRTAAARAGLKLLRIVNEPTAAALAFGFGSVERKAKKLLVYDLGGGTFDVSILSLDGSVYSVLATAGDMFLGGVDFDRVISGLARASIREQYGAGVTYGRLSEERINVAAREAKHALSAQGETTLTVPALQVLGAGKPTIDFSMTLTRDAFEEKAVRLVQRTLQICRDAMEAAKLAPSDIEEVLLVGGQTRMPLVSRMVQDLFERKASQRVHPDEAVALGAAVLATMYEKSDAPVLHDVLPMAIGVPDAVDGAMKVIFARNARLPTSARMNVEVAAGAPLEIAVFQGDSFRARDNEFLGSFRCAMPNPEEADYAEVTFSLSNECILTVKVRILSTGEEKEHKLVTREASDQVLERLGAERVRVAKAPPKRPARQQPAAEAKPKGGGFWGWLRGLFGG